MPRVGLTRAGVIAAGIELVDRQGLAGFADLTLASVAAEVGVAVPSLYKHVSSLADLRRGIAVDSVESLTLALTRATTGRSGRDAVGAMSHALRSFALEHPGRYAATQVAANPRDPDDAPLSARSADTVAVIAAVLRAFDLPPERMIDAIRMLRSALHGFVVLELGSGFGLPDDLDRSFEVMVETVTSGVERLAASVPSVPVLTGQDGISG
ncbi:TetR/AcrR family transcriptional regulator [Lacisediminihabitans sp. H27-G8]|uniref:TetR/AcrR family transcriptional regulator n=1 Tax=Lacisediminihabitans sp. H27-G8 TaxID=3111909 RepID=UPI0038FBE5A2